MANKSSQSDKSAAAPPTWQLLESATWSPVKAGDKVEGTLGSPEMGPFGEQHTVHLFESGGRTAVLPHLTTLRDLSRVPLGTAVRITYKGEKVSKAGNTYKDFSIETAPSGGGAA